MGHVIGIHLIKDLGAETHHGLFKYDVFYWIKGNNAPEKNGYLYLRDDKAAFLAERQLTLLLEEL